MTSHRLLCSAFAIVVGAGIPLSIPASVQAADIKATETCVSFQPMGSSTYEVRKTVSSTGVTPGFRNNWDTDFIVPGGTRFTRYITTIVSELPENFNIIINFRHSDKTSEQVFRRDGARLVGGIPFQIVVDQPATSRQPFQINTNINSRQGTTYRVSVAGCTK